MSEPFVEHNSFRFGNIDMWENWSLRILKVTDFLKPRLRSRKVLLPLRNGEYDYGAKYYNERTVTLQCVRMTDISRHEQRDLAYILSKKSELRIYDDTEKYYLGRIYTEPALSPIRNGGLQVTLEFICEPFAYGEVVSEDFINGKYTPDYKGTAPTPTYIVIENTGRGNATNLQIVQSIRREN